jgi:DNA-directed RNA polymerase specialized sigma subunit
MSADGYKLFVKVNAIYYENGHLTDNEVWAEIARQTDLSEEQAMQIVVGGKSFRYPYSLDFKVRDKFEKGVTIEDKVTDVYSDTEGHAIRGMIYDDLVEAVESLPDKTKTIFLADFGIRCLYCGRVSKNKIPQQDIANMYELYSARAVQKQVDKAVEGIVTEMIAKGWLKVVDVKNRKSVVRWA